MGKNIVMRLLAHSQKRKKRFFRRADLIFWLFLLGISITALLTPSMQQARSQQIATHQTGRPSSYASPMQPHDVCDAQGNCYPDGADLTSSQSPNAGKIQDPISDDAFMFFTRPDLTVGQDGVKQLWTGGVAIVDVFIVLLIAFNGIRIMVSGTMFRYADVAESIPRVLVALIAAHISLALVGILIGLNNSLCSAFLGWANTLQTHSTNMPGNVSFKSIFVDSFKKILTGGGGGLLSGVVGTVKGLVTGGVGGAVNGAISGLLSSLFGILPYLILELMALTMSAMLFGQLIVRILLIDLYTVISAPCIACWALPGRSGQGATSFWLQGTITTVMSQFLQTVGIIVSMFIFDNIFKVIDGKLPGFMGKDSMMAGVNLSQLIVYIAFLWFIIRMPTLFRLNPSTQMIMSGGAAVGSAVSGAVGGVASAAATGVSLVMLVK